MGCGMSSPRQQYNLRRDLDDMRSNGQHTYPHDKVPSAAFTSHEKMPAWAQEAKEEFYREQQQAPPPFDPNLRYQGPPYQKLTPNAFQVLIGTGR